MAQQRGVEGGKRLPQGLGQEHRPAYRGNGGIGRQRRPAQQVRRGQGGLCVVRARRTRVGGLHLGLRGEIQLLQDQADIRVGDEIAPIIHHIGMASLANLDLRHHLPDELQIYLYHRDPRLGSAPGHGNGHMRLGLLAEIDRAKVHLARAGLEEFRVSGEVCLAPYHIPAEAGDA